MRKNDLAVRIGGQAGDGSLTTGDLLAKTLKRLGLWVVSIKDFPSRIRGGHTNYTIRAKFKPIFGPKDQIDILVAFDYDSFPLHTEELVEGGVILYDNSVIKEIPEELRRKDVFYYGVPLSMLAREKLGLEVIKNTIALGALAAILEIPDEVELILEETFLKRKGRKVVEKNIEAYRLGRSLLGKEFKKEDQYKVEPISEGEEKERLLLIGNEAIAFGAIVAGCRFMAGYPITPATEILEFMAERLPQFGGVALQVEDEISAINMALGAAYTGVRAMTATSGPGIALMTEAISLSGMAEIPVVIVDSQRAGPSTGLPTKTEQGDLNHVIFGGHGDFPRIVLSPSNAEEAFYLIQEAFNLAEKYQLPVIFLTEQMLSQNKQTIPPFKIGKVKVERGKLLSLKEIEKIGEVKRYAPEKGFVPLRPVPGLPGGLYIAEGNEHDYIGFPNEDPKLRHLNQERRTRKLEEAREDVPKPKFLGDPSSTVGIIGFGTTYGPIVEAMEQLEERGIKTHYMRLVTLWPFPAQEVKEFVGSKKKVFVVEHNATGQLKNLIERFTGPVEYMESVLKFNGRPFTPGEISERVLARVEEVLV
jgi:2-oxoglutarate ferredoxin oxidoreductase subunit alpha